MEKGDFFGEIKEKIFNYIEENDFISKEVISIIGRKFTEMEAQYDKLMCSNESINEYIYGNLEEIKAQIESYIHDNKKGRQLECVQYMIQEIKRNEEKANTLSDVEKTLDIDCPNSEYTNRILDGVRECLVDIQSRQARILAANGFSDDRIDQIQSAIMYYINNSVKNIKDDVYEVLQQDDKNLKDFIYKVYEEKLQEEIKNIPEEEKTNEKEMNQKEEQTNVEEISIDEEEKTNAEEANISEEKSNREKFLEEIDLKDKLTLEDQKNQAIDYEKNKEKDKEYKGPMLDQNVII